MERAIVMNHKKMNRTCLIFIGLLFYAVGLTAQSFQKVSTPTKDDLHALTFFGNAGWAVSYGSGNLYKSIDKGKTWQHIWMSDSIYYEEIQFTSKKHGYLVGEKGKLLLTNNGGKSWDNQLPSELRDEALLIYGAFFSDSKNGIASCQSSATHGVVYNLILQKGKWKIAKDSVYAFLKIKSFDRIQFLGSTATEILLFDKNLENVNVLYKRSSNAIGPIRDVGSASDFIYAIGFRGYFIYSLDRGVNWREISVSTSRIRSVLFIDKQNGYIVGDQGLILETHDGGLTWIKHDTSVKEDLHRIIQYGKAIWICGKAGVLLMRNIDSN